MKLSALILTAIFGLFVVIAINGCNRENKESGPAETILPAISGEELENEAWEMEEEYWVYVQKIDTVAYKNLWHNDFIGYPSFGDGVSDKSNIAVWIPELHRDPGLTFSYKLHKRAVNAIDDVVLVFYDADEIWTDKENKTVRKETYKFTHTWRKYKDKWVIIGGMAAKKNQDILAD